MMLNDFNIKWVDMKREPQCPPNPNYPNGKHISAPFARKTCRAILPYPAKRCGFYVVECQGCGVKVAITTAGRPDDPTSIDIPCKLRERGS
jgi:hypothetical protein